MKLAMIGSVFLAVSWGTPNLGAPMLDGRAAADYAYRHVFDRWPGPGDHRTDLVTGAMAAGGWSLPGQADGLERFLDAQKGLAVQEIAPGTLHRESLNAVPGDILMADWGVGDETAPAEKNRATGKASEFMVVQSSLGNGDFVFCRSRGDERSLMGRFQSLLSSPNLALARYKIYHVFGNDPTHGLRESALYRDENRRDVFLQINGGLFWAHDDATVKAFGGWDKLKTLPKNTMASREEIPISGTMLRELNSVDVWLVEGRIRRHIRSDGSVRRLGGWEAVRVVPDGSIEEVFPKEGHAIL